LKRPSAFRAVFFIFFGKVKTELVHRSRFCSEKRWIIPVGEMMIAFIGGLIFNFQRLFAPHFQ